MVNKKCFNRADYQRIVKQIIHNMYVLSIINTALYTYIYRLVWPLLSLIQGRRALLCSNK